MVNVRIELRPKTEGSCEVPACKNEVVGIVIFLNIAHEFVSVVVCGDHSQLVQNAQTGVVEVIRFRDKTPEEMTKEELKDLKTKEKEV